MDLTNQISRVDTRRARQVRHMRENMYRSATVCLKPADCLSALFIYNKLRMQKSIIRHMYCGCDTYSIFDAIWETVYYSANKCRDSIIEKKTFYHLAALRRWQYTRVYL
jgi:hypothetical protein